MNDYFNENSDLSDIDLLDKNPLGSPTRAKKQYFDIKSSRSTYGTSSFSIDAKYIQNADAAKELMGWLINKTVKPRKSVGINVFAGSVLQLGDIVQVSMTDNAGVDLVVDSDKRFVVYSIEYNRNVSGPETLVYLSEVA